LEEYTLIENTSKVYYNGSIWESNKCGEFEIIAKTDRSRVDKRGYKEYSHYLCKFKDGTIVEAKKSEIKLGKVRNPNCPSVCNIGYLGIGKWRFYINQKATKEYSLFHNIINRCYNPNATSYQEYGAIGITLDSELHNFQNFCNSILQFSNYDKWKNDKDNIWEIDKDELCEKLNIHPKIYSKNTCQFILHKDNIAERNKRVSTTGHTYIGISPDQIEYEFTNIKEFAREHNLYDTHIGNCIKGKAKQHKGWEFKTKNLFEIALRNKYRFLFKGLISIEELWNLSIIDLDSIYKTLNSELKQVEEKSLRIKKDLNTKIEIVKYITKVKLRENINKKIMENKLNEINELHAIIKDFLEKENNNNAYRQTMETN